MYSEWAGLEVGQVDPLSIEIIWDERFDYFNIFYVNQESHRFSVKGRVMFILGLIGYVWLLSNSFSPHLPHMWI